MLLSACQWPLANSQVHQEVLGLQSKLAKAARIKASTEKAEAYLHAAIPPTAT